MKVRSGISLATLLIFGSVVEAQTVTGPLVRFRTSLGDIDVLLLPASAPQTVDNFLRYVNRGAYNNSIFHRSVPGFIIQAGGFQWLNGRVADAPEEGPVRNEYSLTNARGTIAMAKLGSGPNTATNQWFFNLANNAANLNNQNGGFTVFGRINDAAGLTVIDRIAAQRLYNFQSPFDAIPLVNYIAPNLTEANLVLVRSIVQMEVARSISAGSFSGLPTAAPGSFIEIYGSNLAGTSRQWAGDDFKDGAAPTMLDEVSVTVGGQPAFISYISPGQINVQVPANTPVSTASNVTVTYKGQPVATSTIAIRSTAPGLLAPPSLKVGDRQYVYAVRADGSVVGTASPAARGETIILYGIGFGPVSPSSTPVAGLIVKEANSLATPPVITLGGVNANVAFAGLVSGLVGLYQFNIVVPADAAVGDLELKVSVGAEAGAQSLFLPVR